MAMDMNATTEEMSLLCGLCQDVISKGQIQSLMELSQHRVMECRVQAEMSSAWEAVLGGPE
jgi:hypothetical protein